MLRKRRVRVDSLPQVVRQCIQRHGGGERRDIVCQHAAGHRHMREQLRHVLQQPRRTKRRAVLPALRTGDGQKAPGEGKRTVEVRLPKGARLLLRQANRALCQVTQRSPLCLG